jgi:hypothetical protein
MPCRTRWSGGGVCSFIVLPSAAKPLVMERRQQAHPVRPERVTPLALATPRRLM